MDEKGDSLIQKRVPNLDNAIKNQHANFYAGLRLKYSQIRR